MSDPFSRPARPWDLFNKNLAHVENVVAEERMDICRSCPELGTVLSDIQCKQCGCAMNLKTKLPNAYCPLGKWGIVRVSINKSME